MRFKRPNIPEASLQEGLVQVFPRIWKYALALTGSQADADDLAQSACLRAMERADQFEPGTHLDRWLFRIAHNIWMSEMRRKKVRVGNGVVGIGTVDIQDPSADADTKLQRRELRQSVLGLPEAQRQAVMLVYVEGYSYRDAAMILDIPVSTLMSRLSAARTVLVHKFRDRKVLHHAR
jgi:RNA polymerase sigma-70 factor (ECF subfamily)